MEAFELIDDRVLTHLSPRDFETLLRTLASIQFPKEDDATVLLASETEDERKKGEISWQIGRRLRALRAKTGSASLELRQYVEATRKGIVSKRARLTADPHSSSPVNTEFYARHGLTAALKTANVSTNVGKYIMIQAATDKVESLIMAKTGFEDVRQLSESLIVMGTSALKSDTIGASMAFASMLVHLRHALNGGKRRSKDSWDFLITRALIPALMAKT